MEPIPTADGRLPSRPQDPLGSPATRWSHRTNTRTEWVAEKRTIEVPQQIVRMQREQKVDYEVVGRVRLHQQPAPRGASARSRDADDR